SASARVIVVCLVQREGLAELFDDQLAELGGTHDGRPTGPAQHPVDDLVEPIDPEAERDVAIPMALDLLGVMPGRLGHEVCGVAGEVDRDLMGLVTPVDRPGVAKIRRHVEIFGDRCGEGQRPERLEPGDAVSPRSFGMPGPGNITGSRKYWTLF